MQLFDSWAGVLPEREFENWVVAPTRRIATALKERFPSVPVIGFPRGAGLLYERYAAESGVDAVALDTTVTLRFARDKVQPRLAVQGNLDPIALLVGGAAMERRWPISASRSGVDRSCSILAMASCRRRHRNTSQRLRGCSPSRLWRPERARAEVTRRAVVLMNLGGPDSPEAVRPFLYNLFSDKAIIRLPALLRLPLAALIASRRAATARQIYAQLGGASPLLANTQAQARALEGELVSRNPVSSIAALLRCGIGTR